MTKHLFLGGPMHGRLTELTSAHIQVPVETIDKQLSQVNYDRHGWFYSITGKRYDVYVHGKITDFDSWQVAQMLRNHELL